MKTSSYYKSESRALPPKCMTPTAIDLGYIALHEGDHMV